MERNPKILVVDDDPACATFSAAISARTASRFRWRTVPRP